MESGVDDDDDDDNDHDRLQGLDIEQGNQMLFLQHPTCLNEPFRQHV